MELYSGIDENGNLISEDYTRHHNGDINQINAQNATNALNVSLAKYQNQWNLQQWEREMAYNSPANQLKLLQEAGLNPLFYGQGLGQGSHTQAPQSADMSVAANSIQSQEQARIANIVAAISGLGESADRFIKNKELQLAGTRLEQDIQESRSRIVQNYAGEELTKAQTRSVLAGIPVQEATFKKINAEIAQIRANVDNINEQVRAGKLNNDFLEKTFATRVFKLDLDNEYLKRSIDNTIKDTLLKGKQIDLSDLEQELKRIVTENERYARLDARAKGLMLSVALHYANDVLHVIDEETMNKLMDEYIGPGRSTRNPPPDVPDAVTGEASSYSIPDFMYHVEGGYNPKYGYTAK